MKKYEILEHKADLQIRVFGRTKKELFQNALLAMQESMGYELPKPEKEIRREIGVKSLDPATLLVDFLSEVLYLNQLRKEVFLSMILKKLTEKELAGELIGRKAIRFNEDIKAVTHHGLDILKDKNGTWQATILFDI